VESHVEFYALIALILALPAAFLVVFVQTIVYIARPRYTVGWRGLLMRVLLLAAIVAGEWWAVTYLLSNVSLT
jgi:hypothetical protein